MVITGQTVPSYNLHFGMLISQVITIRITTTTGEDNVLDQHHLVFGILDTATAATRMYASILEVNLSFTVSFFLFHWCSEDIIIKTLMISWINFLVHYFFLIFIFKFRLSGHEKALQYLSNTHIPQWWLVSKISKKGVGYKYLKQIAFEGLSILSNLL